MIKNMFKSPNVLSKNRAIKVSPLENYKHSKNFNFIVISQEEAPMIAKTYPIFFAKDGENILPIAILGLEKNKNVFLDKDANWEDRCYIPSVIRCYPFGVATIAGKDGASSTLSIAYDESYEGLDKKDGKEIFDKDGKLSKFGSKVKKFVENTYSSIEKTKKSLKLFNDLDLLKTIDVNIEKGKKKYKLEAMLQINTKRLNELKDNELLALLKSGAFNVIYAHSSSINNISFIADRIKD
jgi:hypothetical protein